MSYSGDKRLGGSVEIQHISTSSATNSTEAGEGETSTKNVAESEQYVRRLRPRPTRKTERFKTAFASKIPVPVVKRNTDAHKKKQALTKRSLSGDSLAPKAKLVKTNPTESSSKAGNSSKEKEQKAKPARVPKGTKDALVTTSNVTKSKIVFPTKKTALETLKFYSKQNFDPKLVENTAPSTGGTSVPQKVFPAKKFRISKAADSVSVSSAAKTKKVFPTKKTLSSAAKVTKQNSEVKASGSSVPKKVFPQKRSQILKAGNTKPNSTTAAGPSSSKKPADKNRGKRPAVKADTKKSEPPKKKAPSYPKKAQKSSPQKRKYYKLQSTRPFGKTGSCASSRRGSERSRQASGATRTSETSAQSESGRRSTTNNILMRRSRQPSAEENRKRAASDREGNASARRTAGEVSVTAGAAAATSSNNDSESDDPDVSRLQALLEARGLPPRLFGSLGPRMQQVLHRSVGGGSNAKVQQYLLGIQAEGDESQQLQSAIGMCQLLVMGNEDTLAGFPVKVAVPALTNLLKMEHNFDLMNHACRALTYMMEALPHSSGIITDAIPILLDKLQTIQCIDVAEQSLTALDILSRRHASAVLAAGGVSSCLQYIDFFSLPAQRSALSVAANCCYAVGTLATDLSEPEEEFGKFMKASLQVLASRLSHHDKKCVESTCLCFVRLIDSFQQDRKVLGDIASGDLLRNFQRLLVVVPPLLSSGMLVLVIHSMTTLCSQLRELASQLLKDNIAETLHYLLCGKPAGEKNGPVELLPRGSQEMLEITSFVVQLLPRLPKDDPIFVVNDICSNGMRSKTVVWQWRDDSGQWHSYKRHESRIMEMAYSRGEHEIDLHTGDRSTSINFEAMRLLDENTGASQVIQRILASESEILENTSDDIQHDTEEFASFVEIIFPVLCEVYNSSAGYPPVRHMCLHGIHQMVYFTGPTVLEKILSKMSLSSQISSMLSNHDVQVVVGALQLAELVMRKLPNIFKDPFTREGVVHRVKNLSEIKTALENEEAPMEQSSSGGTALRKSTRANSRSGAVAKKPAPYALRTSDEQSSTKIKPKEHRSSTVNNNNTKAASSRPSRVTKFASSFLSNLSPSSWGKTISSALSSRDVCSTSGSVACDNKSGELGAGKSGSDSDALKNSAETEKWLKKTAIEFLEKHYKENQSGNGGQPSILEKLTKIAASLAKNPENAEKTLRALTDVLDSVEVSPFELIQSGIISTLLGYLTSGKKDAENETSDVNHDQLDERVRIFLSVHVGLPVGYKDQEVAEQSIMNVKPFVNIVRKLNQCVGRLEQFPVKSRELLSSRSNILRALTTRQLKCQLQRHPDCQNSKRWLGGPIKVDPLLQMRAIERYLVMKGYGASGGGLKPRLAALLYDEDDDEDDDDDSDNEDAQDEIHDMGLDPVVPEQSTNTTAGATFSAAISNEVSQGAEDFSASKRKPSNEGVTQKLEFYIANHKIPRHMTIYQALQQYSRPNAEADEDRPDSSFTILNNTSFWGKTHLVHYRLEKHEIASENRGNTQKSGKKTSTSRRSRETSKNPLWHEGIFPNPVNPVHKLLTPELPAEFSIKDPSTEALCLLRVVHAISRYWHHMYSPNLVHTNRPLVPAAEFVNNEINAKCTHQLEDPLVIITGQLSTWVQQIGRVCPFILSFETRQLLFKVTAFERDRAMQHLLDTGIARSFSTHLGVASNNSHSSSPNPFVPRLEKKKCSVSRKNLLQQAEKIITEHGQSLAMIEVDYQGEVGTGLGPTLEFFTLTSKEIQNSVLKLWREEVHGAEHASFDEKDPEDIDTITASASAPIKTPSNTQAKLVRSSSGLFPRPIGYSAKHSQITRVAGKFRFLGRFLAKALLDGRLVDVPLSIACYKWILGDESSFTGLDLGHVDPGLSSTFRKFCVVAHKREEILSMNPENLDSLEMDGCPIEDLGLDMCLPGYSNVELLKMGKNTSVTAQNLDKYLRLLVHWTLFEGVKHQMTALRDGFESVIPLSSLCYFYPEELDQLFCGSRYKPWEIQELSEACHPDHGYTQDSESVKALYRILSSYNATKQRNFLQFVTGCPHLPVGGLRSLNPPLTVVRKTCEGSESPDNYLPSVMTCLNYLKLPEYSSEEVMRKKLEIALSEGQRSFLLS